MNEVIQDLKEQLHIIKRETSTEEETKEAFQKAKKWAYDLYKTFPLHLSFPDELIQKRGYSPDTLDFFDHLESLEVLIEQIETSDGWNEKKDQTLGKQFEFRVFSHRWQHRDNYILTRNEQGWNVRSVSGIAKQADKGAYPFLMECLEREDISYPNDLVLFLQGVWERAANDGWTMEQVQEALTEIATWISKTEEIKPIAYRARDQK